MFEAVRSLFLNRANSELVPGLNRPLTIMFPPRVWLSQFLGPFLNLALVFQIPVIAVMATGGGIRAMTSLYGQLAGLRELGLLDCISYITGASGSTW